MLEKTLEFPKATLQNIWDIPQTESEKCEICECQAQATKLFEFDRYDIATCDKCYELLEAILKIQAWMRMKNEN